MFRSYQKSESNQHGVHPYRSAGELWSVQEIPIPEHRLQSRAATVHKQVLLTYGNRQPVGTEVRIWYATKAKISVCIDGKLTKRGQ